MPGRHLSVISVVVDEATATLEHGVLEIWAPKAEQKRELKAA